MTPDGGAGGRSSGNDYPGVAGWLARNAIVLFGLGLLPAGLLYVGPMIGTRLGAYVILISYSSLLLVLPIVAIGLAIPGRAPYPGVPELPLGVARRRCLFTGGLVIGLGNPLWNLAYLPPLGLFGAGGIPHFVAGFPLVLYGAWPAVAGRSSGLRRVGIVVSGRVGGFQKHVAGSLPAGPRRGTPWIVGFVGVGLFGFAIYGFARLSRIELDGHGGAVGLGIAAMFLAVLGFWGLGCLGLALAAGPLTRANSPRAVVSRRLVIAGSLLALVGPFVPFLPLIPMGVEPTVFWFQFVGVEVAVLGLGWRAYDFVTTGWPAYRSITG